MPINFLAVLVAAIAAMLIGGLWYGPLFSRLWMEGMGWDLNDPKCKEKMKSAGPAYLVQFVGALLTAFVLGHILWAFNIAVPELNGPLAGLQGAFWVWLGFILPVKYGDKLWTGKKFKYVAIDLGYYLIMLLVMSLILWNWK
jgi:hypothetical protein